MMQAVPAELVSRTWNAAFPPPEKIPEAAAG